MSVPKIPMCLYGSSSVVDRHRCDVDTDPNSLVHADPDPDPDPNWHQNNADPHEDHAPSFTHVEKSELLFIILVTALPIL
jgi:hypothetical protein